MTIRNEKAFLDGFWDWGIFDSCFSNPKVKVADIDGFVERNGNFLVLETKQIGVPIPYGQQITYRQLTRTKLFTILFLYGPKNEPQEFELWRPNGTILSKKKTDIAEVKTFISRWFEWASHHKVVDVKHTVKEIPYVSKYKKINL
jgi:hypothetical protein